MTTSSPGPRRIRSLGETLVLSLFDRTGHWPAPYLGDDRHVVTVDIAPVPDGYDWTGREHLQLDLSSLAHLARVRDAVHAHCPACLVLLAAPPCTDFASSGAQYFKAKDADGRTAASVRLVEHVLFLKDKLKDDGIRISAWALENPVGRLARLVPRPGSPALYFNPCDYGGYLQPPGDHYTKKTCLWGSFRTPPKKPVDPVRACGQGSWVQKLGGRSDRTKFERSKTPRGFSRAFWEANRPLELSTGHPQSANM